MANAKEHEPEGEVGPFSELCVMVTEIGTDGTREGMIMLSKETSALHSLNDCTSIDCQLIGVERNGHIPIELSNKKIVVDLVPANIPDHIKGLISSKVWESLRLPAGSYLYLKIKEGVF